MELAITLAGTSSYLANPPNIAHAHPVLYNIQYSRPAGELKDVFVFMVTSVDSAGTKQEVMQALQGLAC